MCVCVCLCLRAIFFLYFKKCIKVYNRDFHIVKKVFFNVVVLNFLFIKESWKFDNNEKCFLSSKSAF